jgi:hypothetical protein
MDSEKPERVSPRSISSVEAVQDGRVDIEKINWPFHSELGWPNTFLPLILANSHRSRCRVRYCLSSAHGIGHAECSILPKSGVSYAYQMLWYVWANG